MVDKIMMGVLVVLMVVVCWILALLLAYIPVNMVAAGEGPMWTVIVGGGIIVGFAAAWLIRVFQEGDGYYYYESARRKLVRKVVRHGCSIGFAASCAFLYVTPPIGVALSAHNIAASVRAHEAIIESAAVSVFGEVDSDHDDILTEDELRYAAAHPGLSEDEQYTVSVLLRHLSDVGHVISSSQTLVLIPQGTSGMTSQHWVTTSTYGISREDLKTARERLARKYAKW